MRYRTNRRTGDKISEIGMGTAYVVEADKKEAVRTVRRAYEGGIIFNDSKNEPILFVYSHAPESGEIPG